MRRAAHLRLLCACVLLGGCEYDLDVGPAWEIDVPRVIAVRMVVVEPAPIWEQRLGFDDSEVAPIAEALPGDLVELQALAVDGEGRPRAPESIDALWFQCSVVQYESGHTSEHCVIDPPKCESLDEWTTDVACEIGRGGALQFTFPTLGPLGFSQRETTVFALVAREPGADVERCRAEILASTRQYSSNPDEPPPAAPKSEEELPGCTLVEAPVLIGPRWALSLLAADFGFEPEVPLEQIPYLLAYQPANRAPAPDLPAWFDADTDEPLQGSPPRVRPGQRIKTQGPRWRKVDRQMYAISEEVDDTGSFVFVGHAEGVGVVYFASGPIQEFAADGNKLELMVDETPTTSVIRIVMIVGDRRQYERQYGSVAMFTTEFEVVR